MRRATFQDIARLAGVSKATVSRALAGHPNVEAATRARVEAAAAELGYRRDPALSVIASSRWRQRTSTKGTKIAHFQFAASDRLEKLPDTVVDFIASEGFLIEPFKMQDYPDARRLARILHARQIRGILIRNTEWCVPLSDFPWQEFLVVSAGGAYFIPPGTTVRFNPFDAVCLAIDHALAVPGLKIGFILLTGRLGLTRINEKMVAAYHWRRSARPDRFATKIFHYQERLPQDGRCLSRLQQWLQTHRPDVVIGLQQDGYRALNQLGYRIPADIRYIQLHTGTAASEMAGVLRAADKELLVAAEWLIRHLLNLRLSKPDETLTIVLEPSWKPGASFPEA